MRFSIGKPAADASRDIRKNGRMAVGSGESEIASQWSQKFALVIPLTGDKFCGLL